MTAFSLARLRTAALLTGLSLMLSGCFVSPGKFTSELQLLDNGQFTFTYEGEVHLFGLTQLIKEANAKKNFEFQAYCYDESAYAEEGAAEAVEPEASKAADAAADDVEPVAEAAADDATIMVPVMEGEYGSRECTEAEIAEQRAEWELRNAERAERDRQQMEQISKLIGGIDPTDPEAEAELARRLERQHGFDRVIAKGNGLFEVSYSVSGTLHHDYMFPVMEDFPLMSPFLQMFLRDGDVVRINAPAFVSRTSASPLLPLMAFGGGFGGGGSADERDALLNIPVTEGTFSIVTTGEIRANNTDEGPTADAGRERLSWVINERSTAAPTALIALAR
jgi:hypothetical protein